MHLIGWPMVTRTSANMEACRRNQLICFLILFFVQQTLSSPLTLGELSEKFQNSTDFWKEHKCVFPPKIDYEPDVFSKDFNLKACSSDAELLKSDEFNLPGHASFGLQLCSWLFEASHDICRSEEKDLFKLLKPELLARLTGDSTWNVCELGDVLPSQLTFITKDEDFCQTECVENKKISRVCKLLVAAARTYEAYREKNGVPEVKIKTPPASTTTPPASEANTKPIPESTAKPTPESTTKPTPESTAKPTPESTAKPTPESTAKPTPESTAKPTPESTTTKPTPESTAKPTPENTTAKPTPESTTTKPTPESTAKPTPESTTAKPTPESTTAKPTPESTTKPTPESTAKPTPESTTKPTPESTTKPTPEDDGKPGKEDNDEDHKDGKETGDATDHGSTSASGEEEKKIVLKKESLSSVQFMAYLITALVLAMAAYVLYHNRRKIMGYIVEGGQSDERHRHPEGKGGGSKVKYSKLNTSAEEILPSFDRSITTRNYIY